MAHGLFYSGEQDISRSYTNEPDGAVEEPTGSGRCRGYSGTWEISCRQTNEPDAAKITKNETPRSTDSLNDKTGVHLESRRFDVIIETWAVGYGGWTLVARRLSASRRC